MIKDVIFDFDGTIVDSRNLAFKLLNDLAPKYRYHNFSENELEYLRNLSIIERCKALQIPFYKLPLIKLELTQGYHKNIEYLQMVEGIDTAVYKLKEKGCTVSIISSNSINNIMRFLEIKKINIFDSVFSSIDIFGKDKTIISFIKKYNLQKDEVIYIGDEYRDVTACKKIGIKVIAVTWGYDSLDLLIKGEPDFVAKKPRELVEIISQKSC